MSNLVFHLVVLVVVSMVSDSSQVQEPVCSRFEYDKKLLEYMVETRHEVKEMTKDLRRTEENIAEMLELHKAEMKKLSYDLKDEFKTYMSNITDEVDSIKGKIETVELPAVAFTAFNVVDKSLQSNEIFILDTVLINDGNGYDTKTGVFTAPVRGLYLFIAHVCNKVDYVIHYAIVMNDEWIARSQQFEENDVNSVYGSCSSVSTLTRLHPGDKVWIMCTSGYSSPYQQIHDDPHRRNSFTGVLLHK